MLKFDLAALILLFSAALYFSGSPFWFNPATIGVWLMFDFLSSRRGNKTTAGLLVKKRYWKFAKLYLWLLVFAALIEGIGSFLLGLWSYPKLWGIEPFSFYLAANAAGFLFYPFILMSFREAFNFVGSYVNRVEAVLLSMLMGVLIWEVPKVFSRDWIYRIPFGFEIFEINIIVIAGWVILIVGALEFYRLAGMET